VLSVLARYHVSATFFAVGEEVNAHPDLVRAEILAGMAVGDHSWDHSDLTTLPPASIDSELRRAADAIAAASGQRPACFRPPYGSTNSTVVEIGARLGLAQILWNVDPSDYLRPGASAIAARVLDAATGGGLVIGIHDGGGDRSQTVAALPAIIDGLRARLHVRAPLLKADVASTPGGVSERGCVVCVARTIDSGEIRLAGTP
jgi:peptidoglycan/xylan/chitin deacetylase (PgdA/CDA1 family)